MGRGLSSRPETVARAMLAGALEAMQQSSEAAAATLAAAGATACTDVTGFGLIGHLAEMARASRVRPFRHLCSSLLLPYPRC